MALYWWWSISGVGIRVVWCGFWVLGGGGGGGVGGGGGGGVGIPESRLAG